jgi:hypothetical protein
VKIAYQAQNYLLEIKESPSEDVTKEDFLQ